MSERKVALVTGSGKKRVGNSVAHALAARDFALVIHYHTSAAEAAKTAEELIRAYGVPVITAGADLGKEVEVKALAAKTLGQFGRIDSLVNCAAIYHRKPLEEVTAADVRANLDANLLGTFLMCQHVGLAMVKQTEGGCIVNLGDWAEARPYTDYAAYFPSKAAIPGLTRLFAVELGTRNPKVRVNAVLPGPVLFPPEMPETEKAAAIRSTLVKSEGSPEHVARAVLHFIDNEFVTGACLAVDGGRTIYAGGS
jgi:pteridine reductase